jgi:hypothetical protein
MTALVPGLAMMVFLIVVVVVLLRMLPRPSPETAATFFGLIVALVLFSIVLITHLLAPQQWTADLLKVLVGAALGTGAAVAKKASSAPEGSGDQSSVDAKGATFGDAAKIAGRDINETIERLHSDVANIKDAVIHQNQTVASVLGLDQGADLLLNTIYERDPVQVSAAIESVAQHWQGEGWTLRHFSSDYQGMDGIYLVFSRPNLSGRPTVTFAHSSKMTVYRRDA